MNHTKHSRNHRATGGVNEAEMDLRDKPEARTDAKLIDAEAEERKHGGHVKHRRTARRHGGMAKHVGAMHGEHAKHLDAEAEERKHGGHVKHRRAARRHGGMAKHVGAMHGEHAKHHAGRKPRKAGGKVGSDVNPFTSARHGTPPKGRTLDMEMD